MEFFPAAARKTLGFVATVGVACVTACSGGSSSPTSPPASPPLGGIGSNIAFDQRVNFTVVVPPPATALAVAAARRKRLAGTSSPTNPYVSPNTASVTLQIGTVNGQSPRTLPALVSVNIACPGNNGCSVPIQNIPAAKGVNRFAVQTFSGPGGTGNVISSEFVDVSVPSSQATSFGGTALTIGGFVQSLLLTLNVPGGGFVWHLPSTGTVDVNALDPAGAIIIGNDQLANAIQVSLPTANAGAFTINNLAQLSLQQPAQALTLAYTGTVLLQGSVNASTVDENNQPVATSLPIPIHAPTAPPTPAPTPTVPGSTPKPVPSPLSLYVYDGAADRIVEYSGITNVETGQPFSTAPRRIFEVAADPALNLTSCAPGNSSLVTSMAVSSIGTIYVQTNCMDATFTFSYNFTYLASTQEAVPAQATPTPPIPATTFAINMPLGGPGGLKLDEPHNTLFLQYNNVNFSAGYIIGVPLNAPTAALTTSLGANCLQEIGESISCAANPAYGYSGAIINFDIDKNGFIYIPTAYSATDFNTGITIIPPGDPTQAFPGEPSIAVYPVGTQNPVPTPFSALAGLQDELGSGNFLGTAVPEIAIEGTTLYSYVNNSGSFVAPNGLTVNPGLSGCPNPSSNAVPDTVTVQCADGIAHSYLAVFPNATTSLTAPTSVGINVVTPPAIMLGGDVVGGFDDLASSAAPGDQIAVKDGFAYVVNFSQITSTSEIDVYNLNTVSPGYHTDIQPFTRLVLDPSISPITLAIGPTGTGIGGAAILRRPARIHHDVRAWIRELQRKRAMSRHMRR